MAKYKLIDFEPVEGWLRRILNAVSYARDAADRMRVTVDGAPQVTTFMNNSSTPVQGNTTATIFGPSTWNIMDARETARMASETQWAITRSRWTIT